MKWADPTSIRITVGTAVVGAPQVEHALVARKAEWAALLAGRGRSKDAPPEQRAVWVSWGEGAWVTNATHVLRVLPVDRTETSTVVHPVDADVLIAATKAASAKSLVALVKAGAHVLVAVCPDVGVVIAGQAAVGTNGSPLVPCGPELPREGYAYERLIPHAQAVGAVGPAITGYAFLAATFELAAKVTKATGVDTILATTPPTRAQPHRWDIDSSEALWTIATMNARS